jgi:hypothetical protein
VHAHELHDDYHAPEKGKQLAERINAGGEGGGGLLRIGKLSGDVRKGSRKTGIISLKHKIEDLQFIGWHQL